MGTITEFFVNGDEVWYIEDGKMHPLREGDPIVDWLYQNIKERYPKAFECLQECYAKSAPNTSYFKFLCARRFAKCNFGSLDHTKKDLTDGLFHIERVSCPLQGECPYEAIICNPQMETSLTEAEKRVMRLVCDGKSNTAIADELYLSPNTVKRHIATSYLKVGVKNRAEFVQYANKVNLFY